MGVCARMCTRVRCRLQGEASVLPIRNRRSHTDGGVWQLAHSSLLRVQRECQRKKVAAASEEPRALAAQVHAHAHSNVGFARRLIERAGWRRWRPCRAVMVGGHVVCTSRAGG